MARPTAEQCDEILLDRYLNSDLSPGQEASFLNHVAHCLNCRQQVDLLTAFSQDFRARVKDAIQAVNFRALEKEVLTSVFHHPPSGKRGALAFLLFKRVLTAFLIGGMLALLAYLYIGGYLGH